MIDHKEFVIELEHLKELRAQKAQLEQDVKDLNADIMQKVFELVEYMENSNHLSVKIDGLGLCSLTSSKKYQIDDPVIFEAWMNEHGELSNVMAIHAQKVQGYYKERLENNEELPPGIKTFIKNNITIRGIK